jgi:hypothetical protein
LEYATVLAPEKPFQIILMFEKKAMAYPSEAFFRYFTLVFSPCLTLKH